jgi:hypothetical protein
MHPDADHLGSLEGDDAGGAESGTFDPYLVSTVSATRKNPRNRRMSEDMRVVVDEMSATATSRRASLLNSIRRN